MAWRKAEAKAPEGKRELTQAEWRKIRLEYVKGKTTYKALAEKYGISESTIRKRASKEGWRKKRDELGTKVEQKIIARMCDARAEEFLWIARANDRLGEALDNMLDFVKSQPPGKYEDMRGVESLSKAIAQVVQTKRDLYNLPTEVDKAKIAAMQEKNKLERRRYNFEVRKYKAEQQEKANARTEAAGTVFKVIVEGEGEALDE
jgi:uncharacterized protein YjcR